MKKEPTTFVFRENFLPLKIKTNIYLLSMDLATLRDELHRLSVITDGWGASHEIPEIERDLVLEKLRNLYDAVRFGLDAEPAAAEEVPERMEEEPAVAIDLDMMIGGSSLTDDFADAGHPEVPAADLPVESAASEPAGPASDETSGDPASAGDPCGRETPGPTVRREEEIPVLPDDEVHNGAVAPVPDAASEAAGSPEYREISVEPESEAMPVSPERGQAGRPEDAVPASVSAAAERNDAAVGGGATAAPDAAKRPDTKPVADGAARKVAVESEQHSEEDGTLSLFDIDAVAVKRAKHRVVMALYGDNPVAEPKREAEAAVRRDPERNPVRAADYADPPVAGEFFAAGEGYGAVPDAVPPARDAEAVPQEWPSCESAPQAVETSRSEHPAVCADAAAEGAAPVLGEMLNADVRTVSDVIASTVPSSSIGQEPVTDLRKALCNNDRFLLARDLFNGDMEACEQTIDRLNAFGDLDECMIYITENFDWNPNSDGAKLLVDLLERKLA